jgi:hypothetical protein
LNVSIGGLWTVNLGLDEITSTLTGMGGWTTKYCPICDPDTCRESCGEPFCQEAGGNAMGAVTFRRNFPAPNQVWGAKNSPIRIKASASAYVEVTGGLGLGAILKEPKGSGADCERCGRCNEYTGTAMVGLGGGASGEISVRAFGEEGSLSLTGNLGGGVTGTYTFKDGPACGDETNCLDYTASIKLTGMAGGCFNAGFFNIKANCTYVADGFAEGGTCTDEKTDSKDSFSCSVSTTNPEDCSKNCEVYCGPGMPCGNSCIARGEKCSKSPGKACQGPRPEVSE